MMNNIAITVHALLEQSAHDAIGVRMDFRGDHIVTAVKTSKRHTVITLHDEAQSGWQAHAIVDEIPEVVVTHHGEQRNEFWKNLGHVTSYWTVINDNRMIRR